MSDLVSRIDEALVEANMSARSASKKAGLSENYITNIKNGRSSSPTVNKLKRLAEALGVRYEWLLNGEGSREIGGEDLLQISDAPDVVEVARALVSFSEEDINLIHQLALRLKKDE